MKTIIFDTETTDIKDARLVQLAWKLKDKDVQQTFYKPPVPISFGAMSVHHITNEDVAKAPVFNETDKRMWGKMFQENIPVAHNLTFDVGVMRNEGVIINGGICTLKVARALYPNEEQHKLQYLRYSLGLEVDRNAVAHDARGDVVVLDALFNHLVKEYKKRKTEIDDDQVVADFIRITGQPSLITKFMFGKHKDKSIEQIVKENISYINWLLNQNTLDEDLKYSLKYFINKK